MIGGADAERFIGDAGFHHRAGDSFQFHVGQYLGPADRIGCPGQQPGAEGIDRLVQPIGRQAMVDEADLRRLGRAQQFAGQQIFLRLGQADPLRPDDRTAIAGDQADADMGVADLRALGGKDDVAQQGDRRAQSDRMAVHPAHHRLFDVEQGGHDPLGLPRLMIEQMRVGGIMLHMGDVAAGRKGAAGAGQQHDVRPIVAPGKGQRLGQFVMQVEIDRVQCLGPVERHHQQPPPPLQQDGAIIGQVMAHASLLGPRSSMAPRGANVAVAMSVASPSPSSPRHDSPDAQKRESGAWTGSTRYSTGWSWAAAPVR